jgi:tripartite-type tricarboxylate transporter receptor subunit TctC
MKMKTAIALAAFALAAIASPHAVLGQGYPNKPVRMVVPFPPGGGGDLMARLLGDAFSKRVNQSVVVENKPGGDTVIGITAVAQAAPDGYTLLVTGDNITVHEAYQMKLPYNSFKDIIPVTKIANVPLIIMTNQQSGFKNLVELLAAAKAKPGQIKFAHLGRSTHHYLSFKLLEQLGNVRMLDIPYKGTGPATNALLGGEIDLAVMAVGAGAQLAQGGKAVAIGVTGTKREGAAPGVPTIAEAGLPDFSTMAKFYVFAPGGTPQDIMARLNSEFVAILKDKPIVDRLTAAGFGVDPSTSADAQAGIRVDYEKLRKLVVSAGLKAEE